MSRKTARSRGRASLSTSSIPCSTLRASETRSFAFCAPSRIASAARTSLASSRCATRDLPTCPTLRSSFCPTASRTAARSSCRRSRERGPFSSRFNRLSPRRLTCRRGARRTRSTSSASSFSSPSSKSASSFPSAHATSMSRSRAASRSTSLPQTSACASPWRRRSPTASCVRRRSSSAKSACRVRSVPSARPTCA